jgi:2-polyprenyl-3-methyl-5-hydroxy-6-metoxy-1,4-benzoquinol methylase
MAVFEKTAVERIIPEDVAVGIYSFHLKRYDFAARFCQGKVILDAACGVGYGSYYLSKIAESVIGIDKDQQAIAYAQKKYKAGNLTYKKADLLQQLDFDSETFDVICSFETLEHLSILATYLAEMSRILKDGGVCLFSTPYVKKTSLKTNNIYHFAEYALSDLEKIYRPYFNKIAFYNQRRKSNNIHKFLKRLDIFNIRRLNLNIFRNLSRLTGNVPFAESSLDDLEIVKDDFQDANTIIAICQKG